MKNQALLSESEYMLIQKLSLSSKKRFNGLLTGEQRSNKKGTGIEFSDYKEYQPGDDVRLIDWGIYLRLKKLLVKLCSEEKELTIMIMLDTSRSMAFGDPEKLYIAKKIIAVLTGITLKEGNKIIISTMKRKMNELVFLGRANNSLLDIIKILEEIKPEDDVNHLNCIKEFYSKYKSKCLLVYISDMLYPEWEEVLNIIALSQSHSFLLQPLSKEELVPEYYGEITIVDMENLNELSLNMNNRTKELYNAELEIFLSGVKKKSKEKKINSAIFPTDIKLEKIFNHYLKNCELVW